MCYLLVLDAKKKIGGRGKTSQAEKSEGGVHKDVGSKYWSTFGIFSFLSILGAASAIASFISTAIIKHSRCHVMPFLCALIFLSRQSFIWCFWDQ